MPILRLKLEVEEVGRGTIFSTQQSLAEDEVGWQEYEVATATSDQDIAFNLTNGITTIDLMLIKSDQTISYEINGADTTITLDAGCVHVLWGTNITALTVTNASGSTANLKILIAG